MKIASEIAPEFIAVDPASAFIATVLDGALNPCPAHEAARVVSLTEAIYRSAPQGRMVQAQNGKQSYR